MSEAVKSGKVYGALAKVMSQIGVVGKNKTNPQQGYKFRGVDDVMAHVQDVLAQHGVVVVPRVVEREREVIPTKSGGSMASVRLLIDHTFYADDGSFVVCTTLGEAMDSGDKASNKAMSAALKYALVETLMIPTYEVDRDTEEASPEMAPRQQTSPPSPAQRTTAPSRPVAAPAASGVHFPNYGRAKNQPVAGASRQDLEFYANGARRSLADPAKSRFHASEQKLLDAIETEIARQQGQAADPSDLSGPPPHSDEDAPF